MGMKQITHPKGYPLLFQLERYADGLWLSFHWAIPGSGWLPGDKFVFRLRKFGS